MFSEIEILKKTYPVLVGATSSSSSVGILSKT